MPLPKSMASGLVDAVRQDALFVRRGLRRHPSFTFVAVATLAIGVGAATTALSIANGVLLKSPPIAEPERVVSIWELRSENAFESMEGRLLPYERYEAYRTATRDVFTGLAAHSYAHLSIAQSGSTEGAFAADGFFTSDDYFMVLGLSPAAGRLYGEGDRGVVLSERLWRARFGADLGVVGSTISVDSRPMVVMGIAPPGFVGTMSTFTGDLWVPAAAYRDLGEPEEPLPLVVPIGRLADRVERERAEALVSRVAPLLLGEGERFGIRGARLDDIRWRTDLMGPLQVGLATLLGAAVMLLLVACANIAGLVMARSYDRRREVAVRLAIGSGRARLIRQMVAENVVLFALGGAGGLAIATIATRLLSSITAPLNATVTLDLTPDLRVLALGLSVALATGIMFGLGPARQASKLDLTTSLKQGGLTGRSTRRNAFVVGQVAVATALLVVAGLAVRSNVEVLDVPLGFDPEGVVVATLDLGSHGYDVETGRAFYQRLLEDVRALPGVRSAGLGEVVMLGGAAYGSGVRPVDWEPDAERVGVLRNIVDPGYFGTTRTPIVAGRALEPTDAAESTPVAVINERLAARLWPGENALGRRFELGGREYEVVGIAADGVYAFVFEDPRNFAYYAFSQRYRPVMSLHVRADDVSTLAPQIRSIVAEIDPNVAAQGIRSMDDVVHSNRFMPRFLARSIGGFSMLGLLLAALGLYGMLAVHVAQRRREFGVRQALGAKAAEIVGLVVSRGTRLAVVGCGLGLAGALSGAHLLRSLLYGVGPFDPLTFLGVPVVLIVVSVAASLRPALQATRVDPSTMLREE
jgi:predicted permease